MGLHELDPNTGNIAGLKLWEVRSRLQADFLRMLRHPGRDRGLNSLQRRTPDAERVLMHLVGQLSNPSAALAAVFEAPTVAQLRPRKPRQPISPEPVSRRLGNGVVQRAVVKVLAAARRPMRVAEIHLAVERLLGYPVSENSVGWCLAAGVHGKRPR
jgi:hypothetical protein